MKDIVLFDVNLKLCEEWKKQFKDYPEVKIKNCSFEELEFDRVVTAGNSFGWMTGGIDLTVRNYYGMQIQDVIQQYIIFSSNGELPVGESLEIQTSDTKKPILIYAPTMRFPSTIDKTDIFFVFAKLLKKYNTFACCGLGTLTGGVSEEECAKQMRLAYEYILKGEK